MEAALLGLFMLSACVFTVILWLPSSVAFQALPSPLLRRALTGAAMGLTAVALIYCPWGQRSGAHMNPSVTLTFCRLGKIPIRLAVLYVVAQTFGGLAGVLIALAALGTTLSAPQVQYAVTLPGPQGPWLAAFAEFIISFVLMYVVLYASNRPKLSRYTGLLAGLLVALYVTFESPFSGMSMNPARSFASALPAGAWQSFWIYLTVPPLAMLMAAQLYVRAAGGRNVACCKLHHNPHRFCIFCGHKGVLS